MKLVTEKVLDVLDEWPCIENSPCDYIKLDSFGQVIGFIGLEIYLDSGHDWYPGDSATKIVVVKSSIDHEEVPNWFEDRLFRYYDMHREEYFKLKNKK